jgi:enoyl-CoA hydratase/carnithine racemase
LHEVRTVLDTAKEISIEDAGGTRILRIARVEKKNALTVAMYAALADAIESAGDRVDISSIVITSEGTTFTAGNDLMDFMQNPPAGFGSPVFRFLQALVRTPLPLIAAVPGPAIGIGTTMLLHCDFVYAAPNARFSLPFVDLGLVPEAASSLLLPRVIGSLRASEMLYLGKPLTAEEALAAGLITAITETDTLLSTALGTASVLASKPRNALLETKKLVRGNGEEIESRMQTEGAVFTKQLASPEAKQAFAAFFKRKA